MIPFGKYLSWKCPKCGLWNGRQNNKGDSIDNYEELTAYVHELMLKCYRCRKQTKFRSFTKHVITYVEHAWHAHPKKCSDYCRKKNWEKFIKSNEQ